LTASAFEEEREMILAEGCDDFVRKPFREAEIFQVLARHLDIRFMYQAEGEHGGEAASERTSISKEGQTALSADALAHLAPTWLAQLESAAAQADADVVLNLLEQIQAQDPQLSASLRRLVHDFRFDIIVELTHSEAEASPVH
jgi:CheY-like chemotaxis protein